MVVLHDAPLCSREVISPRPEEAENVPFQTLPEELALVILGMLAVHDLCACHATNRRLRYLAASNEVWRPLALWLPGVGAYFSDACSVVGEWRHVVVLWSTWRAVRAGRQLGAELRLQEKEMFGRRQLQHEMMRRRLASVASVNDDFKRKQRDQQRLLSIQELHARFKDGRESPWSLALPPPPPRVAEIEVCKASLKAAADALATAERQADTEKDFLRELNAELDELKKRRADVAAAVACTKARALWLSGSSANSEWLNLVSSSLMGDVRPEGMRRSPNRSRQLQGV